MYDFLFSHVQGPPMRCPYHDASQPLLKASKLIIIWAWGIITDFPLYRFKFWIHQFSSLSRGLRESFSPPENSMITFTEFGCVARSYIALVLEGLLLLWKLVCRLICLAFWLRLLVDWESFCIVPEFSKFSLLGDKCHVFRIYYQS